MFIHKARYSGEGRSGVCKCGHPWDQHHLGIVMTDKYYKETGEGYIPEECERFGSNETGGLDADGNEHCSKYIDSLS
jgi:hypothetical protein